MMAPSVSNGLRPEDFPLGSLESRAAARALVETKIKARQPGLAEILAGARRKIIDGTQPKPTAEDYIAKAERLAKTARAGDDFAQRMIEAYRRMAQYLRDRES